jgi:regulatory protein
MPPDAGWSGTGGAAGPPGDAGAGAGPVGDGAAARAAPDRLEHARRHAWRALGRRDHTSAELRAKLAARGVEPEIVERVLAELAEVGYVDDALYAQRFAEDRRRLDRWGSERIERRLQELGVEREHIEAALVGREGDAELEGALALLEQRFPVAPVTRRDRDRALGMLVRKGYAFELAVDALRRHAGAEAFEEA